MSVVLPDPFGPRRPVDSTGRQAHVHAVDRVQRTEVLAQRHGLERGSVRGGRRRRGAGPAGSWGEGHLETS